MFASALTTPGPHSLEKPRASEYLFQAVNDPVAFVL